MSQPSFEEFKRAILKASAIAFDPNDELPKVTLWMPEIEALFNSLTRPDWTPVEQGLPPHFADVWVTDVRGNVLGARFDESTATFRRKCDGLDISALQIIAWSYQERPKPYEAPDE